jgi:hypothetical protein
MMRQSNTHQMSSFLALLLYAVVLSQCNAGWVDPDTPEEFLSTTSHYEMDTREYELVSYCSALFLIYFIVNESNV